MDRSIEQMGYDYHFGLSLETDVPPPERKDPNYDLWNKGYRKALEEDLFDIVPLKRF